MAKGVWPKSCPKAMASVRSSFKPESPGHSAADLSHLQNMGEPCAVVIPFGVNEDLGLGPQAAKGFGVQNTVPIPLVWGSNRTLRIGINTPLRLRCQLGMRRKVFLFPLQRAFPQVHPDPSHLANQKGTHTVLVWVPHRETISCYRGLRMFAWAVLASYRYPER